MKYGPNCPRRLDEKVFALAEFADAMAGSAQARQTRMRHYFRVRFPIVCTRTPQIVSRETYLHSDENRNRDEWRRK